MKEYYLINIRQSGVIIKTQISKEIFEQLTKNGKYTKGKTEGSEVTTICYHFKHFIIEEKITKEKEK